MWVTGLSLFPVSKFIESTWQDDCHGMCRAGCPRAWWETTHKANHVGIRLLRSQIRKHRWHQGPDDRHESQMHLPLSVCGVERMEKEASVLIVIGWNLSKKKGLSYWIGIQKPLSRKMTVNNVCQLWVFEAKVTVFEKVISLDYSYSPTKITDSHVVLNP